jgi:hypothetical protein
MRFMEGISEQELAVGKVQEDNTLIKKGKS